MEEKEDVRRKMDVCFVELGNIFYHDYSFLGFFKNIGPKIRSLMHASARSAELTIVCCLKIDTRVKTRLIIYCMCTISINNESKIGNVIWE